jgi:cytochrome c oxidase cbb3-type subunit 3
MQGALRSIAFLRRGLILAMTCGAFISCNQQPAPQTPERSSSRPSTLMDLPNGDIAGAAQSTAGAEVHNPFEGQASAVTAGKRLFVQMNCAGCHNYSLKGGMGPNLSDRYWRYGGTPAAIYQSIAGGRPQGMPAWYQALPPSEIWQLVTYIEWYGGTTPPAQYQSALQGDVSSPGPAVR